MRGGRLRAETVANRFFGRENDGAFIDKAGLFRGTRGRLHKFRYELKSPRPARTLRLDRPVGRGKAGFFRRGWFLGQIRRRAGGRLRFRLRDAFASRKAGEKTAERSAPSVDRVEFAAQFFARLSELGVGAHFLLERFGVRRAQTAKQIVDQFVVFR